MIEVRADLSSLLLTAHYLGTKVHEFIQLRSFFGKVRKMRSRKGTDEASALLQVAIDAFALD